MTREQQVRHEALLQLYGAQSLAVTAEHIAKVARRNGDDFSALEVTNALVFLVDQTFAKEITDPATGAKRYRITAAGSIHYEQNFA